MNGLRLRRVALTVALAVLAGGVTAAPVPAASSFGLNIQSLVNWDVQWTSGAGPAWEPYIAAMARDGMTVARTDAAWSRVQPSGPGDPFDWSVSDRIAETLALQGIRWLPVVDLAPAWAQEAANPRLGCAPLVSRYLPPKPEYYDEFAAYAAALAVRYGPPDAPNAPTSFWTQFAADHPGKPTQPIAKYEIWNEANVDAYWNNAVDAADYRALYDQARTAIKAVDPAARVLVGGVVWGGQLDCAVQTNDAQWLQALVGGGGVGWQADGIAIHPYGPALVSIVVNVRRMQRALRAVGRGSIPLEQTELGWALKPTDAIAGSQAATNDGWFPEATRAGNYALVTDTLQSSDCAFGDQYGYAVVERERSLVESPPGVGVFDLMEHWMGIYPATAPGTETLTSRAYAGAIARDRAVGGAARDVRVCGADPAPGRTLDLDLAVAPAGTPGCWNASVTYRGLPVREAQIVGSPQVRAPGGGDQVFTGMTGEATFCASALGELRVRAQIGEGAFAADFAPLVARSAENVLGVTELRPASADQASQPVPACILNQLGLPAQRLSTVARRGRLTTRVRLATLAPGGPCQTTLTLSIPVKIAGKGRKPRITEALLGTVQTTIGSTEQQTVVIALSRAGRKRLRRERSVRATVRIGLPQAVGGAQAYARQLRLRR